MEHDSAKNKKKSIRAFFALTPPGEILREIENIQESLREFCPFDVRWVQPENVHLTVKFFGNISEHDIETLSGVAEGTCAAVPPIPVTVGGLGLFPSVKRPRVLWIGLEGATSSLSSLQRSLDKGLETWGFAKEERPFRPHLTIGRIRSPRATGAVDAFLAGGAERAAGRFVFSGLSLFQSDLTPKGAVYTERAWFPFRAELRV